MFVSKMELNNLEKEAQKSDAVTVDSKVLASLVKIAKNNLRASCDLSPRALSEWRKMALKVIETIGGAMEWTVEENNDRLYDVMPYVIESCCISDSNGENNVYGIENKLIADYIVKCQPKNIVLLIDEIEYLQNEVQSLRIEKVAENAKRINGERKAEKESKNV